VASLFLLGGTAARATSTESIKPANISTFWISGLLAKKLKLPPDCVVT